LGAGRLWLDGFTAVEEAMAVGPAATSPATSTLLANHIVQGGSAD
jgi:hypothetical protein